MSIAFAKRVQQCRRIDCMTCGKEHKAQQK